jgi:hypothetical protein
MLVIKCISLGVEFGIKGIKIGVLVRKIGSSREGTTKTGQPVLVQLVRRARAR